MRLENYYISGLSINLEKLGLGIINQPTIKEMFQLGLTNFDIVSPFIILEKLFHKSDVFCRFQLIEQFHVIYDSFSKIGIDELQDGELKNIIGIYDNIVKCLKVLYKTDDISWVDIANKSGILIKVGDTKILIFNENFDKLCNIIFEMFFINKEDLLKDDDGETWIEHTGSQREKELIEYFKEKERRKKERERLELCDYINLTTVVGNYTYEEILNMTYYQLMSLFTGHMKLNNHKEELGYRWSFKYNIEEQQKNWMKECKLDLSTVKF